MKIVQILLLAFSIIFLGSCSAGKKPASEVDNKIKISEDAQRLGDSNGMEWWYFDGVLDDGTSFVTMWGLNKPGTPFINLDITWPNGEKYTKNLIFQTQEASFSKDKCAIKIGNNILSGDLQSYSMHLETDDLALDLNLENFAAPFKPEDNQHYFSNGKYYAWFNAIPGGTISGKIKYNGEEKTISGKGYHDHNWSDMSMSELGQLLGYRYWGRVIFDDYTIVYDKVTSKKSTGSRWLGKLYVAKGNRVLANYNGNDSKFSLEEKDNQLEIKFTDQDNIELTLNVAKENQINASNFQNTQYERYAGPAKLNIKTKSRDESYESSNSIWEYMNYGE